VGKHGRVADRNLQSAATGAVPMTWRQLVARKALAGVCWTPPWNYRCSPQAMRGKRRISMGGRRGQKRGKAIGKRRRVASRYPQQVCRCRCALAAALHVDQFKREVGSGTSALPRIPDRIAFDSRRIGQRVSRKGLGCLRRLR
jgi:hypothetical protein